MSEHFCCPHRGLPLLASLLTLLLTIFAKQSQADISCYASGTTQNLNDDFGVGGLEQCTSTEDICYELFGKPGKGKHSALYNAGCGRVCPDFNFEAECKTCSTSTSLCNNVFAKEIKRNNIMCYLAGGLDRTIGSKRVWCGRGVTGCYWVYEFDKQSRIYSYVAGCARSDCKPSDNCVFCTGQLCNVPESMKQSATGPSEGGVERNGKGIEQNGKGVERNDKGGDIKKGNDTESDGTGDDGVSDDGQENEAKAVDIGENFSTDEDNRSVPSATAAFATVLAATLVAAVANCVSLAD